MQRRIWQAEHEIHGFCHGDPSVHLVIVFRFHLGLEKYIWNHCIDVLLSLREVALLLAISAVSPSCSSLLQQACLQAESEACWDAISIGTYFTDISV